MFAGSEKAISVESQLIPELNETRTKTYPQFSSLCTEASNAFVQTKPFVSAVQPVEAKTFSVVTPNSSTDYTSNERIELNYTCNSTPVKNKSFQTDHSLNASKLRSDPANELENTVGFIPSNNINFFLNQPLDVQTALQVKPHSSNYAFIRIKNEKDAEVSLNDDGEQQNRTVKRRVQNYGKLEMRVQTLCNNKIM